MYEEPTVRFLVKKASLLKKSYNYGDSEKMLRSIETSEDKMKHKV